MNQAALSFPAVAAFLRGVERRAALLAELQCGDPVLGDAALGAAMRAFGLAAHRQPMAEWPRQFWGLLLAAPQLRRAVPGAERSLSWRPLAALGNGQRAALLLRLVAGLALEEAAAVLAVPPPLCREAVRQALHRTAEGRSEADAWSDWDAAFQQGLRTLPAARLARLARLREQALAPGESSTGVAVPLPAVPAVTRAWRPAAAIAGVCVLALAATFVRPGWFPRGAPGDPQVRTEALPSATAPAATFDDALRAWSHRDFDLIADPEGLRQAQGLPFLAWYAALRATQAAADAASPAASTAAVQLPDAMQPAPAAGTTSFGAAVPDDARSAIARIPAPMQPELRTQAGRWASWTASQRTAYRQRMAQWDAQSPAARAEQRERYAAWNALDPAARGQLAAAAQAYAALPPEQREGLRTNFIAQDATLQRGWLLGPALGAEYPRLQPLIAQLPQAHHAALLRVLRALTPPERNDLAVLAQRTPPQERAELLRALMSTAGDNRATWLHARVTQ